MAISVLIRAVTYLKHSLREVSCHSFRSLHPFQNHLTRLCSKSNIVTLCINVKPIETLARGKDHLVEESIPGN